MSLTVPFMYAALPQTEVRSDSLRNVLTSREGRVCPSPSSGVNGLDSLRWLSETLISVLECRNASLCMAELIHAACSVARHNEERSTMALSGT